MYVGKRRNKMHANRKMLKMLKSEKENGQERNNKTIKVMNINDLL
jgi:hypothetical protein